MGTLYGGWLGDKTNFFGGCPMVKTSAVRGLFLFSLLLSCGFCAWPMVVVSQMGSSVRIGSEKTRKRCNSEGFGKAFVRRSPFPSFFQPFLLVFRYLPGGLLGLLSMR